MIPQLRENGTKSHTATKCHAEIGGAAFTDDVFDGHPAARIADIPPRIAVSGRITHSGRGDLDRPMIDAHADQSVRPDRSFGNLYDDASRAVLYVHVSEEVGRDRVRLERIHDRAHRNRDPLLPQTVEAVQTFDADDGGDIDVQTDVEVVPVAQTISDL